MRFINRYVASGAAVALLLGGAAAASATTGATGANGFTQVHQTRVFDSGRIVGDTFLASGGDQEINPNAVTKGLVPAGATAVQIQITAAQETSVNGDLDVTPNAGAPGTSNLNYNKGVAITSSTVAELNANGEFYVYNHAGGAGSVRLIVDILGYYAPTAVYTPPATLTADTAKSTPETVATGGEAYNTATDALELTFPVAGTYQVSVNAKATPTEPTGSVQVYPEFYVYDQTISSTWAGDLFNLGSGALESGANANIDSYYTGSGLITVTAGEELHIYAGGYDSDRSAGTYTLDDLNVVAVSVTVPAS